MEAKRKPIRAIISGGGTGGHIFPAVSIGKCLKELNPDSELLFVGAQGKMEMEKVPAAGFKIVGLPILGIQRQLNLRNIKNNIQVPFKVLRSLRLAGRIIDDFKPDIVIGVGGYASAPLLWKAVRKGVPALIQEQNGFAGLTNKILSKKVQRICVAYEGMERFFPAEKIVLTGNPIRPEIKPASPEMKQEALEFYGLDPRKKHIVVLGGSLGSRTLNNAMYRWITDGCKGSNGIEVLWQCGRYYKKEADAFMAAHPGASFIHHSDFITRMDLAYALADVVVSRSGASSVSEICAAAKASILVPSPNVAEDHQTHNAMALVKKGAAQLVRDSDAEEVLMEKATSLARNSEAVAALEANVAPLARTDAALRIANEIYDIIG